jgi:hypothetical protein
MVDERQRLGKKHAFQSPVTLLVTLKIPCQFRVISVLAECRHEGVTGGSNGSLLL